MSVWENLGGIQGKVAAVLIAVFAAGAGTGYFAGRWHALEENIERASAQRAEFRRARSRGKRRHFIRRLEGDLDLETNQLEKIRSALRQQHERMMQIRMGMRPQVQSILQDARKEIRILLNSDQQRGFDEIVREYDERRQRWRRRMERRMRGGGHPRQ